MPSLEAVAQRRVEQSTKIYDRTGEVLLYDLHKDVRRTLVPLEEMSPYIKNATIAIEDDNFYRHFGIEPTAILRAVINNLKEGNLLGGQGGSTITQQVVKNTLLEPEKTLSRKFKEWILAVKLERRLSKDEILELYLNEAPYGGTRYGVEEASQGFFGKPARDLTLAEAAYLAALPQAPTYYSPYGNHRDALEKRKNLVLERMRTLNFITEEEYQQAKREKVIFLPQRAGSIKAPHFVFYVIDELRRYYTEEEIQKAGLRVITTLNYNLQEKGEEIVKRYAEENTEKFNATNAALVALDPRTGEILTMVGSRDYFDEEIDGNFNIALAERQPGSAFKPFVYAAALEKGYTSETVVFDVATQFSTACDPSNLTSEDGCYSPKNYDNRFRGPVTFREALAQSINVPAVKALYLAGTQNALDLARRMGITTLGDVARYGLTLVLGGGEVRLLDMVSAYGVFANEGVRHAPISILRIEDRNGNVLRDFSSEGKRVLDENIARTINDMLADNEARTPAFGARSYLFFPGREVAAKTGTTNDYRDAWIIGYTPEIVAGAWAGNNDNSSMEKKVAGFIVAPLWNAFLTEAFQQLGSTTPFTDPPPLPRDLKPVLRGIWQGNTYFIDITSGKLATENTPDAFKKEVPSGEIRSILHWVNKDDPRGPIPENPAQDPQYPLWEFGVDLWKKSVQLDEEKKEIPQEVSDTYNPENAPSIRIISPKPDSEITTQEEVVVRVKVKKRKFPIQQVDYFINGEFMGTARSAPYTLRIPPEKVNSLREGELHTIYAVVYDQVLNKSIASSTFTVLQ